MGKPVRIGVVTCGRAADRVKYALHVDYIAALRSAAATPVLFAPGEPAQHILELVDGVLLAGGGDLAPARYASSAHALVYGVDEERDATELELARLAVERRVPILGVCRGLQVLNVALGGSLHQHVPDVVGERVPHRGEQGASVRHSVEIVERSLLREVCATATVVIASTHHQAAAELGTGVSVTARASDGLTEAIEVEGHPACLAVQWHPESTAATDPTQQRLFSWLTARARHG